MAITAFNNEYRFLSNFYPAEVYAIWNDDKIEVQSIEHAYQAAKAMRREDFDRICQAETPGQAKRLARRIILRPAWDALKFGIMENLLRQKFANPILRHKLLSTGDEELIEGNTWGDVYWGCVFRNGKWVGQNNLGRLLMKIRAES